MTRNAREGGEKKKKCCKKEEKRVMEIRIRIVRICHLSSYRLAMQLGEGGEKGGRKKKEYCRGREEDGRGETCRRLRQIVAFTKNFGSNGRKKKAIET